MDDKSQNTAPAENNNGAVVTPDTVEPAPATNKRRPKKRFISSITQRTAINYVLFALVVLAMLWISFFIGLYSFYGEMLKSDIEDVRRDAMLAFPKRGDDNSMNVMFKLRVTELARTNSAAVVVFGITESGEYDIRIAEDSIEGESDPDRDFFNSVMGCIDFDATFAGNSRADTVSTDRGSYLYCGGSRNVDNPDGESERLYLIVIKPYNVFNAQTIKIVNTLIIGTVTVLVIACVFAFFASEYQTKQLKDFSQKAKRLAEGETSVHFEGNGYDEYENLASALNEANERTQKTEQLQRDLVANVTHDIRTPLTMIRAYAEMLRDMPMADGKRQKTASVIISETDRLTKLVEDAMNFSRLQSGVAEFKFEPCDLAKTARSTLAHFDIYRERDGFKFVSDIDKKAVVSCDMQKIEQVLYNLIINAVNYSGEDKTVILRVKNVGDKVRVEVSDHGKGIPADELDAVWDRYYRAAHSRRTTVGTGLGLSICKNILSAHNAEFGVTSTVGEGSTFWFELLKIKKKVADN